ncbi:hypothetical protein JCM19233_633 [Vibrio astriarenae]|nr:hypothetical protein JCM19233_633 [Vibrio sp. C7]
MNKNFLTNGIAIGLIAVAILAKSNSYLLLGYLPFQGQ